MSNRRGNTPDNRMGDMAGDGERFDGRVIRSPSPTTLLPHSPSPWYVCLPAFPSCAHPQICAVALVLDLPPSAMTPITVSVARWH